MIVPFPAGGANDVVARIIAERVRQDLGQRLVIENVGGADGSVGVGRLARARPDGYTICLGIDGAFVLNGAFYSLPYDLLNDFAPIAPLVTGPILLLARTTLPAQNLEELVAWLKAHPGLGSAGMNHARFSSPRCALSTGNADAIHDRSVSGGRRRGSGPRRRPHRSCLRDHDHPLTDGAKRQRKGYCGGERNPLGARAGNPDLR
jgi:hypothetical protein